MESRLKRRNEGRRKRLLRNRRKLRNARRPRLAVFRSPRHIYAQIIDDLEGRTLVAASTRDPAAREELSGGDKKAAARWVGARIAQLAKERNIEEVVFDRRHYLYHGRVRALAEAAREGGLRF